MRFVKRPSPLGDGSWYIGREKNTEVWVKVSDTPSEDEGIDGGRIVDLEIKVNDVEVASYAFGWKIEVPKKYRPLYESILKKYN